MKWLREWIAIIAVLLAFIERGDAQVIAGTDRAESFRENIYGLGISGGAASGLGVSFRAHFPSLISVQFVGGIIKSSSVLSSSLGAQVQYDLVRGRSTRFFGGMGVSYYYSGESSNDLKGPFRLGLGVGGEFLIQQSLSATLGGMFTYFSDGVIVPLPELSIHYYFR
ncbi:MAG: hypothetical protein NTV54_03515 [Ignavibacteriales bacterium]|nr:hypothetical protein [Ignavibacteriales bacterium]